MSAILSKLNPFKCFRCPTKFTSTCCEKSIHPNDVTHHNEIEYTAGKVEFETDSEPTNCLCEFIVMKWCICRIKKGGNDSPNVRRNSPNIRPDSSIKTSIV